MKKGLYVLVILAAVAGFVPDAMADHCYRCFNFTNCFPAASYGKPFCDDSSGSCVFSGATCTGPHPFIETGEPLAAKFTVASVERLDDPQVRDTETRVASLETTRQKTAER